MATALPRSRRVLIVEDNDSVGKSLQMLVEVLGHEARLVGDGDLAVRTSLVFKPDVVLMDLGLPKLNGLDAAYLIRKAIPGKKIRIVALTGWGKKTAVDAAFAAGM